MIMLNLVQVDMNAFSQLTFKFHRFAAQNFSFFIMAFDIFITLLLVSLNGFFVAAEFAIVKVRASQLEVRVKRGERIAILSKHIVSHLDGYLAATQLGITLASLGLGWIGEPVVSKIIVKIMDLMLVRMRSNHGLEILII